LDVVLALTAATASAHGRPRPASAQEWDVGVIGGYGVATTSP